MRLCKLITGCSGVFPSVVHEYDSGYDPEIVSITPDSKKVEKGSLFIAIKGSKADGHDYIKKAFENGAAVVIAEYNPHNFDHVILTNNSRLAAAGLSACFFGYPSKKLTLIGITGTNGKTTCTWLLESILKAAGFNVGVIGTVNIRYNGKEFDNGVTTPDSIELQKTLYEMQKAGVSHVIMEASSHGLDQHRVDFCEFDAGIFTNLTQDHLDYHKDIQEYFECKKRLFTELLKTKKGKKPSAIVNIDDEKGALLFKSLNSPNIELNAVGVSTHQKADIISKNIKDNIDGLSGYICLDKQFLNFASPLTGRFNLENILCVCGAAQALGISPNIIKKGIESCKGVPGRLEKVSSSFDSSFDRFLFVDYAHTPDALESILSTLKSRAPKRLITIFGCGGDRDSSKRSLMGNIALEHSDIAIVTSDNPRTEDPEAIITDILKGMSQSKRLSEDDPLIHPLKKGFLVETDRKKAIQKAISISKPGDIVIAAGKGHETYQITNSGIIHFDDREELQIAAHEFQEQFKAIPWTAYDLAKALNTEPLNSSSKEEFVFSGVSTDSRNIKLDEVFLALKGERFDAHTFVPELLGKGIKGFILQKSQIEENLRTAIHKYEAVVFETDDSLAALGALAHYQRQRSNVKVLALTGSNGKTTTRRLTEAIFKTRFHTLATEGNLNNEIGVPMTLLKLSYKHEWAIVEMGMNHAGELSRLSKTACPDIAMITNTAPAHLEELGTVENVALAKAEIFEGIKENGMAILFADDPRLPILEAKARENKAVKNIVLFGSSEKAAIRKSEIKNRKPDKENYNDVHKVHNINPDGIHTRFCANVKKEEHRFSVASPAPFMVNNCLAAIAAANAAGIDIDIIQKGIKSFAPVAGRMDIQKLEPTTVYPKITLIDDSYNANPGSVENAMVTLKSLCSSGISIAVLGDMLELGNKSDELHRQIGHKAAEAGVSQLFVFGEKVANTVKGAMEKGFPEKHIFHGSKAEIACKISEFLKDVKQKNKEIFILVKGSRGMAMEELISNLLDSH